MQLSPEEKERGVVAFSSGNHAQGVAIAARRLRIPAIIVMPSDAPNLKVEGTRANGAEIVFYDRMNESREEIAASIAAQRGGVVVPSFDDIDIVTGQGTIGLEIVEQLAEVGQASPPAIIAPVGGGGLLSGIALAVPGADIHGAEPEGWDDMKRSLAGGEIVPVGANPPPTLCDALQTPRVSPITFGILRERGATIASVTDGEVSQAVRWAYRECGLTVEPGGAAALAAVQAGKTDLPEGSAIVLSGGNIDPELLERLIA
jgi:threonine dehydratase